MSMPFRRKLVIEGVNVKESTWPENRGTPIIFVNMIDGLNQRYYATLTERVMRELEEAIVRVRNWNVVRVIDRNRSNWPGEG